MHRYFRKMRAPSFINYVRGPPSLINVSQSDASIPRLFLARLHGSVTHGTSIPRRRNKSASSRGWRCRLPRNQFEATLTRSIIGSRTRATNSRIKLLWRCQGRLLMYICISWGDSLYYYIVILHSLNQETVSTTPDRRLNDSPNCTEYLESRKKIGSRRCALVAGALKMTRHS